MLESEQVYRPTIYYMKADTDTVTVGGGYIEPETLWTLLERGGIILWENQGLFVVIPTIIIVNAWNIWDILQKLRKHYPRIDTGAVRKEITWDQGLPLSPGIANGLLAACEKCDSLGDTGGT